MGGLGGGIFWMCFELMIGLKIVGIGVVWVKDDVTTWIVIFVWGSGTFWVILFWGGSLCG
jgi:hypothetical protein